jgi:hypothetical protein
MWQLSWEAIPESTLNPFSSKGPIGFNSIAILRLCSSTHVDKPVLQSIHALSIPVRLGIAYVARTESLNWSISQSLCHLECAVLLSDWLRVIGEAARTSGVGSLRENEKKLLRMVTGLIQETDRGEALDHSSDASQLIGHLSVLVVRLWAETFQGPHIFPMVQFIGTILCRMTEILERSIGLETRTS